MRGTNKGIYTRHTSHCRRTVTQTIQGKQQEEGNPTPDATQKLTCLLEPGKPGAGYIFILRTAQISLIR